MSATTLPTIFVRRIPDLLTASLPYLSPALVIAGGLAVYQTAPMIAARFAPAPIVAQLPAPAPAPVVPEVKPAPIPAAPKEAVKPPAANPPKRAARVNVERSALIDAAAPSAAAIGAAVIGRALAQRRGSVGLPRPLIVQPVMPRYFDMPVRPNRIFMPGFNVARAPFGNRGGFGLLGGPLGGGRSLGRGFARW